MIERKDPDGELLDRVVEKEDFFRAVLDDTLDDWDLAKDFGEFLTRIEPEDAIGYVLLVRACRHLGDWKRAVTELDRCRVRVAHRSEEEVLLPFLAEEGKLLSKRREEANPIRE